MFIGNLQIWVAPAAARNLYGEDIAGTAVPERGAVVELLSTAKLTNQRAQMAGSMAHAEDLAITAKVKLEAKTSAAIGSMLVVGDLATGVPLRIVSLTPKYTTMGVLDHFNVECTPWA